MSTHFHHGHCPTSTFIITTWLFSLWGQENMSLASVLWSTYHTSWHKISIFTEFTVLSQVCFCTLYVTKWTPLLSSITGFKMHFTVFSLYLLRFTANESHCEWFNTYQAIMKISKCFEIDLAVKYFPIAPWRDSRSLPLFLLSVTLFSFDF